MALVLKDRVKQAAAAPGTGTITLGATATGFQSFASVGNANTTYFAIVDPVSGDWEVNYGTYTSSGTTLTRNATPLSSSAGGALVNFTGAVDVFVTYPSSRSAYQNEAGTQVVQQSFGAITATSAALTTGTITTAPVNNTDIVNKQYADAIASGIHFHEAVNLATTAALPANTYNNGTSGVGATLTGNANGALSVDSTLTVVSERILVKNEAAGANNGVYTVTQVGSAGTPYILTRATDFDSVGTGVNEIDEGDFFLVTSGTANVNTAWVQQTPPPITIGTTALVFQQFSAPITYTAGTGLSESPTYTFNIANTGTAGTYGSSSFVPVFVTNAQGQVTSVTNTAIAINGSAVSGNISGSAGSVANALTLGTYLTGGTYNGSGAVTATVDATSANTASKVVARDASGNFSAGTITATFSGNTTSATNLAGGAANQIPYQTGSGATAFITAASGTNTVLSFNGSAFTWSAGTISGVPLGSNLNSLTAGTYLTGTAYNGSAAQTWTVDATSANTASKVVARDASGNFSAGTITATLSGNATSATNSTTTSQRAFSDDISTTGQGRFTGWYSGNAATGFAVEVGVSGGQGYIIPYDRNTNTYGILNISTSSTLNLNGGSAALQLSGSVANVTGALQQGGSQVLTAANYNSYAPTLTGTGASGTWGINITGSSGSTSGNAATATALSSGQSNWVGTGVINNVVGMLAWKNYGNSHVIFDASAGTSPSGGAVNNTNSAAAWSSTYPTLMGWNGANTYGVRVDSARISDSTSGSAGSVDFANLTNKASGTGTYTTSGDYRAPIFYDSNDTTYYLDPNSTTSAILAGSVGVGSLSPVNTAFGTASTTKQIGIQGANYGVLNIQGTAGTPAYYSMGVGDGHFYAAYNNLAGIHGLTFLGANAGFNNVTNPAYNIHLAGTGYATSDWRAPIFYDSDNTAYYLDPASTSELNKVYYNSNMVSRNYGIGQVGLYDSTKYQAVFSMGEAYILPANGTTTGNLYGIAWSHPNAGGAAANLASHGILMLENGGFQGAWGGGSLRTPSDVRGTLFYDYSNTGYYVDPASTSNLNTITVNGSSNYYASNYFYSNQNTSGSNPPLQAYSNNASGAIMAFHRGGYYAINMGLDSDNIFRLGGWSAPANLLQITMAGALTMASTVAGTNITSGGNVTGSSASCTGNAATATTATNQSGGTVSATSVIASSYVETAGPYYRQAASKGYLNGQYPTYENGSTSGAIYSIGGSYVPGTTSLGNMYGVGYTVGNISGIGIIGNWGFYVASNGVARIFLDSDAGVGYATGSFRASLFYDYDNTAYYLDPASTSNLNNVQIVTLGVGTAGSGTTGEIRATANVTAYYSSDIKFKTNVRTIPNAIETVESIGGKLFDWNDEYIEEHGGEDGYFVQKEDFGVIAQDVQAVFPVAVRTRPDGSLAVDYEKLSALAFAAVAELSTRVKSLEARI